MASGTQSYASTSGSLIDPAQRQLDKILDKNKDKDSKKKEKVEGFKRKLITIFDTYTSDIESTAGMLTGVSNNLLEPGRDTPLLPSADDISPDSPQDGVIKALTGISDDIKAQNQILILQTKMLTATLDMQNKLNADTKRLRRESRAEETEDLSGTQGVINTVAKTVGGGGGSNPLGGISDIVSILADVNQLRNIPRWFKKFGIGSKVNAASNIGKVNDISRVVPNTPLLTPASGSTSTIFNKADISTPKVKSTNQVVEAADQIFEAEVLEKTILNDIDEVEEVITNTNKTNKVVNNLDEISEVSEAVTSTNKIVDTADVIGDTSKVSSNLAKVDEVVPKGVFSKGMDMLGAIPGAKYILPGASGVSGVANIASGNYAEGAMDLADASLDVGLMTGAVSQTGTLATTMGPAIAVTGAGLVSGWLGEMTRGTDEWVRGDGTDAARNAAGDVTAGLSGALETVGAPFTALVSGVDSLVKHGDFSESNKKMAEVDSNIREGFRKFLNVWDPLNVISDDVGSFGTLSLYGEENVEAANEKLLVEKGVKTEENNETNTKNIESTANKIEETSDIESTIIKTVIQGGTSGDPEVDQKIWNHYRILELTDQLAETDDQELINKIMLEMEGIDSGEIKAQKPSEFITENNSATGDTTTINNDNTTGDTTTSSVVTGDSTNINKPESTITSVMNNNVKENPEEKIVVINNTTETKTETNQQNTSGAEHQIALTDKSVDGFKDITLLSALGD